MKDSSQKSVADSLETDEHLLPHMPYLLQDLWAMGCSVNQVLDLIGTLKLTGEPVKVLDLGCGKGALSVQMAAKYGYHVTGIDAMPEFLKDAKDKAKEYEVSHLCKFIEFDILQYILENHDFNVVIFASLGGALGDNKTTVEKLRSQVTKGGYIIIDDGYLRSKERISRRGYGHYRNYDVTKRELTGFNDTLLAEESTTEESKEINNGYLEVINKRAQELIGQKPEMATKLKSYIQQQKEECDILEHELEGTIWVIQKTRG